jgi:hypothetical protein
MMIQNTFLHSVRCNRIQVIILTTQSFECFGTLIMAFQFSDWPLKVQRVIQVRMWFYRRWRRWGYKVYFFINVTRRGRWSGGHEADPASIWWRLLIGSMTMIVCHQSRKRDGFPVVLQLWCQYVLFTLTRIKTPPFSSKLVIGYLINVLWFQ